MTSKPRYIINSPPFLESSGGIIVLHYLCHLINELGREAYIYRPELTYQSLGHNEPFNSVSSKVFSRMHAPICTSYDPNKDIIVYPEIVTGNPLGAKNVVRWLLYRPGAFTGVIDYGPDELIFFYQEVFDVPELTQKRGGQLLILYYLSDIYKQTNFGKREGICYLVKKGFEKEHVHEPKRNFLENIFYKKTNSILIDPLSHEEKAAAFNQCEIFISYDPITLYLQYAGLCGAIPVVIPDEGVAWEEWQPHINGRYGIAYGLNQQAIEWAKSTRENLISTIHHYEKSSRDSVENFIKICDENFKN